MADVYLVVLIGNDTDHALEKLEEKWADCSRVIKEEKLAFVSPRNGVNTADVVQDVVGIGMSSDAPSGMVVKIENPVGVMPRNIVDWLREAWSGESDQ